MNNEQAIRLIATALVTAFAGALVGSMTSGKAAGIAMTFVAPLAHQLLDEPLIARIRCGIAGIR